MARRSHPWLASLLFSAAGCSLMVDTADIDRGCNTDEKVCMGHCVSIHDPAYGCTKSYCEPCELNNAIPRCSDAGSCMVSECLFGFGCPNMNGCPADLLSDSQNCGGCNTICTGTDTCQNGTCRPKQ